MSIAVLLGKQLARAIRGTGDEVSDETVGALGKVDINRGKGTDANDASVLLDSEGAIKKWQEENSIPENKRQKN